ncbi:alpha/beta fold hydrolase [Streptomyces sp. NPDC057580]|uniref:alpha/beta fold hydrolase n=1 Tax=Streptomyces sp. NPDC057580 TaxID=3346173 RepID=UPI0036D06A34
MPHHLARKKIHLVLLHGFLDDRHVWDRLVTELQAARTDISYLRLDLPGCGDRLDETGPFTLEHLVDDIDATVTSLDSTFVLVGQSMAAPVAELVAARRPARTLGLVLLTPIPLAGTHLPDEAIEPFRALGGDAHAQRAARCQLSAGLADADLDRLAATGAEVRPEVVRAMTDCWNTGYPDGARSSRYTGPVLVLRGAEDPFVTEELVAGAVTPRFAAAECAAITGAGHWAHLEQPRAVAERVSAFLARVGLPADNSPWGDDQTSEAVCTRRPST